MSVVDEALEAFSKDVRYVEAMLRRSKLGEDPMAPSPLTVSALRKLAQRRGYRLRKTPKQDEFYLIDMDSGIPQDSNYTQYELERYLRSMHPNGDD